MMESFILEHMPTIRPRAADRYRTSIRALLRFFEGKGLDEISTEAMAEFEMTRRREGVTDATIIRDLACMSSAFTHAQIDKGWIETNPVAVFIRRQMRRGRLVDAEPRTRYLSQEEEDRILAAAPLLRDHVAFAIDTGLRQSEQFGLRWRDVLLSKGEIVVPRELAKGEKSRKVPILPRAARILAQARPMKDDPERLVFCHKNGTRYRARGNTFKEVCQRIGLKDVTWHDLRRTCGCRLLQGGFRMEQVRDWLGHASIRITETTYAFLSLDSLKETAQNMAQVRRTGEATELAKSAQKVVK